MKAKVVQVKDEMMPQLYLDDRQLPEIRKWRIGGKYRILLDVEQVGMNAHQEEGKAKDRTAANFRIISIKPVGTTTSKDAMLKALDNKAKQY